MKDCGLAGAAPFKFYPIPRQGGAELRDSPARRCFKDILQKFRHLVLYSVSPRED